MMDLNPLIAHDDEAPRTKRELRQFDADMVEHELRQNIDRLIELRGREHTREVIETEMA